MRGVIIILACLALTACGGEDGDELWIYTSIYPSVIKQMEPALAEAFPGVRFRWYQKGSEQVAARLNVEIDAGETPCDLLMTSDPFYYRQLDEAGRLLRYPSTAAARVAADLRDPNGAFATVRIPLMVIAVNAKKVTETERPNSFKNLTDERFKGKVAMGDPLKSGTTFTTVAALVMRYGWEWVEGMRANDVISAGGNSAVLHKLETGERPVGVILLENLLPSLEKGAPIAVVYPDDGAIPVPSPVAILKSTDKPDLAKQVYDFMFGEAMQAAMVAGHMYAPVPGSPTPAGARPWKDVTLYPWNNDLLVWVTERRDEIKKQFRTIMRR